MNRAKISRKSQDTLEAHQDQQADWVDSKSKKSGWGRFLGAAALGGLALATGGSSLVIGAAAGLGSRLGSEGGENLADRGNIWGKKGTKGDFKPKKLDEELTLYRNEASQINRDTRKFERDFDMKQNTDAAKDAYSAYNIANVAQAYGGAATAEAAKAGGDAVATDAARVASQSPLEGVKSMGSDWKSGAKKLFGGGAKDVVGGEIEDNFVKSVTKGAGEAVDLAKDKTALNRVATGIKKATDAGGAISSVTDILSQGPNASYEETYDVMQEQGYKWSDLKGWWK